MLKINFCPESDDPKLVDSAKIYQKIWKVEGSKIVPAIERISGLKFKEKFINAIVFEGISYSHPLRIRASYPDVVKKGTLIHELCHRLLVGNKVEFNKGKNEQARSLEIHKQIYLILYDIWLELYGRDFAHYNVEAESTRGPVYKKALGWVLSFEKKTRQKKFRDLISRYAEVSRF